MSKKKVIVSFSVQRYDILKQSKGSGKAVIATARKIAVIIWHMLTREEAFNLGGAADPQLTKKAEAMRRSGQQDGEARVEKQEKPAKGGNSRALPTHCKINTVC
ncbi:MAG: hypothetical protein FWC24_03895 [Treponema sp.]|nr:hypothetical protein [Treponema sp.]